MRKSKTKENQVDKRINSATDSKSVKLRYREPLKDKTNKNVNSHSSAMKKNTSKSKTIEPTTMKTRRAKQTIAVVGTRTRSQATSVTKPTTRKAIGSTKVRTRKSVGKSKYGQGTKLSDNVVKHMKSARVILTRISNVKNQTMNSKKSLNTTNTDNAVEISDDSSIIRQSARISLRKNKQNNDNLVVIKDPTPTKTFRKPLVKSPVKGRQTNPLAVYEFEFDPKDDPKPKLKRKRGQVKKYSSDSSGEDDNSMKVVVKRLRKLDRKGKKINEQEKQPVASQKVKKVAIGKVKSKPKPIEVKIQEMFQEILDKKSKVKQHIVPAPPAVVENIDASCCIVPEVHVEQINTVKSTREVVEEVGNSFLEDDSPDFDDSPPVSPAPSCCIVPEVHVEQINTVKSTREVIEEVANSFLEDDSPVSDDLPPVSPAPIHVISNVLIHKANDSVAKPVVAVNQKIFNSTLLHTTAVPSSPWRINVSTIRKKPHAFTVKDKSFIPSYDQDIIEVSSKVTIVDKTSDGSGQTVQNENNMKRKECEKVVTQTSILDFIKSSKPRPVENKSVGLFDDVPIRNVVSPRKVLGEINYLQSTPYKPTNSIRSYNSPNISVISPKRNDTEDSMFGFSFLSDSDNINDGNKENTPHRRSPRKQKVDAKKNIPTRISINEVKRILTKDVHEPGTDNGAEEITENPKTVQFKAPEIAEPAESDLSIVLFEDLEDSMKSRRITKQYVRKHPKRKRLPSVESLDSDNESDTELPAKKKTKETKRTKAEEEEIERLASFYNSMFEEIEQHPLCIE